MFVPAVTNNNCGVYMCFSCLNSFIGRSSSTRVYQERECDVCIGIENDRSKKKVYHCGLCNAWLCDACTPRLVGRGWLALKKLFVIAK